MPKVKPRWCKAQMRVEEHTSKQLNRLLALLFINALGEANCAKDTSAWTRPIFAEGHLWDTAVPIILRMNQQQCTQESYSYWPNKMNREHKFWTKYIIMYIIQVHQTLLMGRTSKNLRATTLPLRTRADRNYQINLGENTCYLVNSSKLRCDVYINKI